MKQIFIRSIFVCVIFCLFALIFNWISPNGVNLITRYNEVIVKGNSLKIPIFMKESKNSAEETAKLYEEFSPAREINLEQTLKCFGEGGTLFIDARAHEEYIKGHIPGAINIPIEEISISEIEINSLDVMKKIIIYCDSFDCTLSLDLAMQLEAMGFGNVHFFLGGWLEWIESNYQVSVGENL